MGKLSEFKPKQFHSVLDTLDDYYQSAYVFEVVIACDNYCTNSYSIQLCASYNEAVAFIKKHFFKGKKFDVIKESDKSWFVSSGDCSLSIELPNRRTSDSIRYETYDVREIRIFCNRETFILDKKDGMVGKVIWQYPDEIVDF